MLVVDLLSPVGHYNFNRFFIETLKSIPDIKVTLVSKTNYTKDQNVNHLKFIRILLSSDSENDLQGFKSYFFTIINYIKVIHGLYCDRKNNFNKKIFFLSYNPVSHLVLFFFLFAFGYKLFVVEHNSIPVVNSNFKNRIKVAIYRIANLFCKSLVLEDFIHEYLDKKFSQNSIVIKHPCFNSIIKNDKKNVAEDINISNLPIIFSPSGSTKEEINRLLCEKSITGKYFFIGKGRIEAKNDFYIIKNRFDNYYDLMNISHFVLISNDFVNRVSGVFYEALASSKYILIQKSEYSRNLIFNYPNVIEFESLESIVDIVNSYKNIEPVQFDSETHNNQFKNKLTSIIYD